MKTPEVTMIDPKQVRVFVSRARLKEGFEAMRASMGEIGLKQPIEVRDIGHLPASDRRRPDGGLYRYELTFGEGRLTAALDLGWPKIAAMVASVTEAEQVGRFLAENIIRDPLPWFEKASLVAADLDAGLSVDDTARKYFVTPDHVNRCRRIVSKTAQGLETDVAALPMRHAEALTTLPAKDQLIVMDVLRETGEKQIEAIVRKAKAIKEDGELSPTALKASLESTTEQLRRTREKLKLARLHHSLGPANLQTLFADKKFRAAALKHGVNVKKFEEIMQ